MNAETTDKLEQMERFLSMLKDLQSTRKKMIERFAALQAETEAAGFTELSAALGDASSSATRNFEKLDAVVHRFEIQRNQIRNEAA